MKGKDNRGCNRLQIIHLN